MENSHHSAEYQSLVRGRRNPKLSVCHLFFLFCVSPFSIRSIHLVPFNPPDRLCPLYLSSTRPLPPIFSSAPMFKKDKEPSRSNLNKKKGWTKEIRRTTEERKGKIIGSSRASRQRTRREKDPAKPESCAPRELPLPRSLPRCQSLSFFCLSLSFFPLPYESFCSAYLVFSGVFLLLRCSCQYQLYFLFSSLSSTLFFVSLCLDQIFLLITFFFFFFFWCSRAAQWPCKEGGRERKWKCSFRAREG